MEQILLEATSRHLQGKKMTRNSQYELSMSHTNPTTFYNEMGCVGKGRVLHALYVDYSKAYLQLYPYSQIGEIQTSGQ